jgi:peptidoglycan-associated lipoprotein
MQGGLDQSRFCVKLAVKETKNEGVRIMAGKTVTLIMGLSLIAVAGCAKKQRVEDLPPPPLGSGETGGGRGAPVPGSQEDFVSRVSSDRVFFDTDKSDIDAEDQAILSSQAAWLKRYPNVRATIEGHCDERGTRDYNIALGARRANAAKNYLASAGIDPARITTVSYGKERPEAVGSDETSWARNRRAVTVTVQ